MSGEAGEPAVFALVAFGADGGGRRRADEVTEVVVAFEDPDAARAWAQARGIAECAVAPLAFVATAAPALPYPRPAVPTATVQPPRPQAIPAGPRRAAGAVNAAEAVSNRQVQAVLELLDRDETGGAAPLLGRAELLRAVRAALAVAPAPVSVRTAGGIVTAAEAVAFQAGQAAASAAVRATAELACGPGAAGDPSRREVLGGQPEHAALRAAVRAVLALAPLPLRTEGDGAAPAGVARAFDAGQRVVLGGVATAVAVALHPARPSRRGREEPPGAGRDC